MIIRPLLVTITKVIEKALKSSTPVTITYPGSAAQWIQVSPALELAGGMPEV